MITILVLGGHPLKVTPKVAAKHKAARSKKVHPIEKNPLVKFFYPNSKEPWNSTLRDVRVIGANAKYLVGVQINGRKAHFKKFLKAKMSEFQLTEFSPLSVS